MILFYLNIKYKKSKDKIKLKNIVIINLDNIFKILVLKIYNCPIGTGYGQ